MSENEDALAFGASLSDLVSEVANQMAGLDAPTFETHLHLMSLGWASCWISYYLKNSVSAFDLCGIFPVPCRVCL